MFILNMSTSAVDHSFGVLSIWSTYPTLALYLIVEGGGGDNVVDPAFGQNPHKNPCLCIISSLTYTMAKLWTPLRYSIVLYQFLSRSCPYFLEAVDTLAYFHPSNHFHYPTITHTSINLPRHSVQQSSDDRHWYKLCIHDLYPSSITTLHHNLFIVLIYSPFPLYSLIALVYFVYAFLILICW